MTAARSGPVVDALFFATVFTVTFAKLQWEVAGTLSLSDVLTGVSVSYTHLTLPTICSV